ncbi:MAG: hypothetical protein K6L81_02240 [Agarilytica sp.]
MQSTINDTASDTQRAANKSFSALIKMLSNDYYNHRISFSDYRAQRRDLLNKIDFAFNQEPMPSESTRSDGFLASEAESLRLGDTLTMPVKGILDAIKNKI